MHEDRRLNLGCGKTRLEGFTNVDFAPGPEVDRVVDLEQFPLPWGDGTIEEIMLSYVIEHISHFDRFWSEITRILKPGGRVTVKVLKGAHPDPFHNRRYTRASVTHFTNGYIGRYRLVGNTRTESLRNGFPYWHLKHYLGLDVPWLSRYRGLVFVLEKVGA